jgi:hypothetical protein
MSNSQEATEPTVDAADDDDEAPARDVERSLLRTENERLRRELRRTTRTTYRRTAVALLGVGLLSALAGLVVPAAQDVLVVVGAIGVFGGVLTWYLTPERVLAASVTESVYRAHAKTIASMRAELGLRDTAVYAPSDDHAGGAVLFLPLHAKYDVPDESTQTFVTTDPETGRGVTLHPTAGTLARALDRSLTAPLGRDRLPTVVPEAIVEQFELADNATADLAGDTLTLEVDAPAIDGLDRADHPIVSLCAVTAARTLDQPVEVESIDTADGRITVSW